MGNDYYTFRTTTTSGANYTTTTDNTGWYEGKWSGHFQDDISDEFEEDKNKIEGVEMLNLYDVYMVYGEDRKKPEIEIERGIIAKNEEDAKIKSGLMQKVDPKWDADYLSFIVVELGEVKVKEKAKEVKNI